MAEKVSIWAEGAPAPFGHFPQAIKYGNVIHISGQLPLDPGDGKPVGGDIEAQTRRVLDNITAILQAAGGQLSNVMRTTIYLTDLRDFPAFDKLSKEYFYFVPPARTTVQVAGLPGGCRICVDAIAELNPTDLGGPKMI